MRRPWRSADDLVGSHTGHLRQRGSVPYGVTLATPAISQSASQPTSYTISQPVNQPVNQPVSQSASQAQANQPISQQVTQSVNQPISQPVNQPVSQHSLVHSQFIFNSVSFSLHQLLSMCVVSHGFTPGVVIACSAACVSSAWDPQV